ncbi:MAG TPA: protein kinase [Longimicrobiales bacterium]
MTRVDGFPDRDGDAAPAAWDRVKALFVQALDLAEPDRTAFVIRAADGDDRLRDEVLSLLASERAAGPFAEIPAPALFATGPGDPPWQPRLPPATRLGAYEITSFLSAGGMGEVYRARHTVLGRTVAIKTLSAQTTDPHAKRRLIREAQHAAHLVHPNICTIHEVGEADGIPFIVMELVDGRSLTELVRERKLSLDDALAYGQQVADALEHAHEHGIVHRDLKSSNIVVDGGNRPVVLDFGLSKRSLERTDGTAVESTVTMMGALAGTLSHMAPEVLLGGPADVRSDVWSLGVLLHEMVTGALPFQGRTPFETTSAILNDPPRASSSALPLAVRLVIERCLLKDPNARYQSAAQVRSALDAIRRRHAWPLIGRLLVSTRRRSLYLLGAAAVLVVPAAIGGARLYQWIGARDARFSTIAVLPIENATGTSEADYYAEGLTEALIGQLGAVADVQIISRASAVRAARDAGTLAAARRLRADAIVGGRLREAGERVTVDIRLIEPTRGRVLSSETYERPAGQALALQADVVRALATGLRLTVRPGADDRLATVRAVTPAAYAEYLKGRFEWNLRTPESLQRAIAHFERAIELDPTYAPPYAALADCYNQFGTLMVGTGSPREFRPRAEAAAIRALQIDPYSAEAHAALGYVRHYDWRWADAEAEFRRAIELNPSYANARIWYANLLMSRRRFNEALEQVHAGHELDPFSLIVNTNLGWVLTAAGRYDEAIVQLTQTLKLDSTYAHAHWRLSDALRLAGRTTEAYDHARHAVRLTGGSAPSLVAVAHVAAARGDSAEVRTIVAELQARARRGYVPPGSLAEGFALIGALDSAFVWVGRAFEERSNWVSYLSLDMVEGPIQRDPRFREIMARYGAVQ